jgi:hypothetical protein
VVAYPYLSEGREVFLEGIFIHWKHFYFVGVYEGFVSSLSV